MNDISIKRYAQKCYSGPNKAVSVESKEGYWVRYEDHLKAIGIVVDWMQKLDEKLKIDDAAMRVNDEAYKIISTERNELYEEVDTLQKEIRSLKEKSETKDEIISQFRTVIYCYESVDKGREIVEAFTQGEEPSTDELINISRSMLLKDSENSTSPHEWRLCERLTLYQQKMLKIKKERYLYKKGYKQTKLRLANVIGKWPPHGASYSQSPIDGVTEADHQIIKEALFAINGELNHIETLSHYFGNDVQLMDINQCAVKAIEELTNQISAAR